MRPPKGFTSRDLVVLLCLVALALPVLAGALQGAISLSAAERCRANLAALARCIQVYAAQNRGYMPIYAHVFTSGYIRASDNTFKSAVAFSGSMGINPDTGLLADARNLGIPYGRRLIRPAEMLYCPAARDARCTLAHYPKPWGSAIGEGSMFIRVAYMWNPWVKRIPGGASHQWTFEDGLLLRRHPANWPLLCDLVWSMAASGHIEGGSAFWNMAYPDGHAVPVASQELYELFATGFDANSDWALFNDYVRPKILPPPGP